MKEKLNVLELENVIGGIIELKPAAIEELQIEENLQISEDVLGQIMAQRRC